MANIWRRSFGKKKAAPKNEAHHEVGTSAPFLGPIWNEHDDVPPATSTEKFSFRGGLTSVQSLYRRLRRNRHLNEMLVNTGLISYLWMDHSYSDRQFVSALVERWSSKTHTFQMPKVEIGLTPYDFTTLTGISVGTGQVLPEYRDPSKETMISTLDALLPGFLPAREVRHGAVTLPQLEQYMEELYAAISPANHRIIVRAFVMYLVGALWFPTARGTVNIGWLLYLQDVDVIQDYDWGSAILARIYLCLDRWKQNGMKSVECFWQAIEYLFYEYLATACPVLVDPLVEKWPRITRWGKDNRAKVRNKAKNLFPIVQDQLELRSPQSIRWDTFEAYRQYNQVAADSYTFSLTRVMLLDPQCGGVYFLAERCTRQLTGAIVIPMHPPDTMAYIHRDSFFRFMEHDRASTAIEAMSSPVDQRQYDAYYAKFGQGALLPIIRRAVNTDFVGFASVNIPELVIPEAPVPETTWKQYDTQSSHPLPLPDGSSQGLRPDWSYPRIEGSGVVVQHQVERQPGLYATPDYASYAPAIWREAHGDFVEYAAGLKNNQQHIHDLQQEIQRLNDENDALRPSWTQRDVGATSFGTTHASSSGWDNWQKQGGWDTWQTQSGWEPDDVNNLHSDS